LYTIVFALVLGSLDAALLTWAGKYTEKARKENELAEEYRNVLGVLKVPHDPKSKPETLLKVFDENVKTEKRGDLTLYEYGGAEGSVVAINLDGPGVWGPMRGFMALSPDFSTIRGLTFYKQEETPGLGGEISKEWFTKKFIGKKTAGADGKPGIRILRGGGSTGVNEVDAISGATMTCDKVQQLINKSITTLIGEK
jgi:Na+-transporting NADH:ubiquinone oxidoreductase subunit C